MNTRFRLGILLAIFLFTQVVAMPQTGQVAKEATTRTADAAAQAPVAPRPLGVTDVADWKRILQPIVSNDGQWFAYRWAPNEGDSDVVIRRVSDGKELKFPAGESGFASLTFSEDSKWVAFTTFPAAKEMRRLRRERKPIQTKTLLVNLATEKKVEFEKIGRFAFSGEQANWLALHRTSEGGAATPAPPAAPPANLQNAAASSSARASGRDLILHDLTTGSQFNIGNVSEFAFNKKGDYLALIIDAADKVGNGIQLRQMATGTTALLENDKANYRNLNWNDDGNAFAALKGVDDKQYEGKLYSVVAFSNVGVNPPQKTIYDPKADNSFPAGMTISANRAPSWTDDRNALLFGIQEAKKKKDADKDDEQEGESAEARPQMPGARRQQDEPDKPDMVIWHHKDARLQSQQQVQANSDLNLNYLSVYRVDDKKFFRLADDSVKQVSVAPKQRFAIGTDSSEYEYLTNLAGQRERYQDVYVFDLKTGARKLALKKITNASAASPDGAQFLYYQDGNYFTYDMTSGQSYNITQKAPTVFYNNEDDHNVVKPPRPPMGWTKDSAFVLLSDGWDIWQVSARGAGATNLTGNGKKDQIRYRQRYRLDADEKGIDLSQPIYANAYGEWTKKSAIVRIENGKVSNPFWEDAAYGSLMKAKHADKYFYTRETYNEYPNYYVADAMLKNGVKLTNANPQQQNFQWSSGVRLVDYTSAKGDKLQGALFLPANYEPGKSYPTIVYIYEKLSQGANAYTSPSVGGFNKSLYTSQGYAVLMPDIVYKINDPGMSAVWCVLPALEAAIKTGVVDRARVGIHGHSWGGYQTAFLITQSEAFRAAVAGAALTNMISMYSLIYWNTGSANQPIFESSQGRFLGGYWDNMEAYTRNSPVYHAKNVKTPLMLLHNDKDGAVDFTQGVEYFNTLRRLGKSVVMLQYKGENHGLSKLENRKDYSARMLEFFDYHLKGKPAPAWLQDGVPHLKMKEHLEERVKIVNKESGREKPEFVKQQPRR